MKIRYWVGGLLLAFAGSLQVFAQDSPDATLDALHRVGSSANPGAFTALLAENVVFLGVGGGERLEGGAVRNFVNESFASGNAWPYRSSQRAIQLSDDGSVAWFDESLVHETLGRGRGTGVLVRSGEGWKIAQYSLTVPLPNGTISTTGTQTNGSSSAAAGSGTAEKQEKPRCQMISHKTNTQAKC